MNSPTIRQGDAALADVADVGQAEERVLVLAPTGRDAVLACTFLIRAGVRARTCRDMDSLCRELQTPTGAALISEEAFADGAIEQLARVLDRQPPWSDLPVLVLGDARADAGGHRATILDTINNTIWIQRPAHTAALMSAVQTALRARRRQYQLREHLVEREAREQAARAAARLEQTLRSQVSAARDDLERVLASIRDELVIVDSSWRVRYVNDQAVAYSALPKSDMLGKNLWELFSDMVGGKFYHEAQRAMSERRQRQFEYYHPRLERWFEYRLYPQSQGLLILKDDVTERKRTEQRSLHLAAIVESSADAIISQTPDGIITSWNTGAERLYGYAAADAVGRAATFVVPPQHAADMEAALARVQTDGGVQRVRTVRARQDGSLVPVMVSVSPIKSADGAVVGISTIETEITPVTDGEARERAHVNALQAIMDAVPAGVFIADSTDCAHVTSNRAGQALLRLTPGANASLSETNSDRPKHFRVFHDGRELPVDELPLQAAARGKEMRDFEEDIVFDDGTHVNLYGNAVPLYDEHGQRRGAVAAFVDITAHRRAEQALHDAAARYRYIFEGARVGIWELDFSPVKHRLDELSAEGVRDFQEYFAGNPEFIERAAEQIVSRDVNPEGVTLWEADSREQLLGPVMQMRVVDCEAALARCLSALAAGSGSLEIEITITTLRDNRRQLLCHFAFPHHRNHLGTTLVSTIDVTERRRIMDSLQKSEAALAKAQAIAHVGSWEWDIVANVMAWSDEMYRIFGLVPQSQAVAYPDFVDQMVRPADRLRLHDALRAALEHGTRFEMDLGIQLPDASERIVQLSADVVRDAHHRLICIVGTAQDITERKRAEDALRIEELRFRTAAKSVPLMMCHQDRQLVYTWAYNPTNVTGEKVLGKRDSDLLANTDEVEALTNFKRGVIDSGKPARAHFELHIRGRAYQFDVVCEPTRDGNGEVTGITCAAMDITDHVNLQAQLRRQAEQLARMDQRKNEFMAMLAHELRNPLAPIHNAVHVLKIQPDPPDAKHVRWALDVIGRQVHHLARLVDDLLDIARITHGRIQLHRRPVDLAEILAQVVETARPSMESRGHEFRFTAPPGLRLYCDPTRLAQIVGNLLNNAARYTPAGGHIELTAEADNHDVMITVRDDGIGIPADILPYIFDLFMQGTRASPDEMQGGLGLGLTLVHRLAELHGGRVTVHSAGRGQGSTFCVYLPIAEEVAAAQTPDAQRLVDKEPGARILVVDDNKDVAQSFAVLLGIMGHTVRAVSDGAAALEAVKQFAPDMAFIDIGLPDIDGYELGKRLRTEYPVGTLRLVALTGYGQEEVRARAQAAGFDAHVLKPGDVQTLEALLATLPPR